MVGVPPEAVDLSLEKSLLAVIELLSCFVCLEGSQFVFIYLHVT